MVMEKALYHPFCGENGRFAVLYDEFGFLSADQNQEGGSLRRML